MKDSSQSESLFWRKQLVLFISILVGCHYVSRNVNSENSLAIRQRGADEICRTLMFCVLTILLFVSLCYIKKCLIVLWSNCRILLTY